MAQESQEYSIEDLKPIEVDEMMDLSEYEGKKVKIEKVEVINVDSRFDEHGNQLPPGQTIKSKALKVTTEKVGEIKNAEGDVKDIRASELFSLKQKDDDSWGWSTHKKAKIQKLFMRLKAKYGELTNPKQLIGKEVTITMRPGEDISWLGFMI